MLEELQKEKEEFLKGIRKSNSNISAVDFYDRWIKDHRDLKLYKCKCGS